jgi:hypothetical protein
MPLHNIHVLLESFGSNVPSIEWEFVRFCIEICNLMHGVGGGACPTLYILVRLETNRRTKAMPSISPPSDGFSPHLFSPANLARCQTVTQNFWSVTIRQPRLPKSLSSSLLLSAATRPCSPRRTSTFSTAPRPSAPAEICTSTWINSCASTREVPTRPWPPVARALRVGCCAPMRLHASQSSEQEAASTDRGCRLNPLHDYIYQKKLIDTDVGPCVPIFSMFSGLNTSLPYICICGISFMHPPVCGKLFFMCFHAPFVICENDMHASLGHLQRGH